MPVKITKTRISLSPFPASAMRKIGEAVRDSVRARIKKGLNANDQPSKSLTEAYARRKSRRGLPILRDLIFSGKTLAAMAVTTATREKVAVSFNNPKAILIVNAANKRERIFAESPADRRVRNTAVAEALKENPVVKVIESQSH